MHTIPNKIEAVNVRAASTGDIGTFNAFDMPVKKIVLTKIVNLKLK